MVTVRWPSPTAQVQSQIRIPPPRLRCRNHEFTRVSNKGSDSTSLHASSSRSVEPRESSPRWPEHPIPASSVRLNSHPPDDCCRKPLHQLPRPCLLTKPAAGALTAHRELTERTTSDVLNRGPAEVQITVDLPGTVLTGQQVAAGLVFFQRRRFQTSAIITTCPWCHCGARSTTCIDHPRSALAQGTGSLPARGSAASRCARELCPKKPLLQKGRKDDQPATTPRFPVQRDVDRTGAFSDGV